MELLSGSSGYGLLKAPPLKAGICFAFRENVGHQAWLRCNTSDKIQRIRKAAECRRLHNEIFKLSTRVRECKMALESGFLAVASGFQVLDYSLCLRKLDSGF